MTKLLEEAIAKACELPESEQDLAAEVLLTVIHHDAPSYHLTPEQVEEVKQIRQDLREGRVNLLSEGEIAAFLRKLGV
jgi:ABC-type histidine transport system ATPase subunit